MIFIRKRILHLNKLPRQGGLLEGGGLGVDLGVGVIVYVLLFTI